MFAGFVSLTTAIRIPLAVVNPSTGVPVNADALPTYRVYGDGGLLPSGTGSAVLKDTGSITGATNASPIVITSAGHNLQSGMKVTITGVGGNTNANGTWIITVIDNNTFSLNTSTGNAPYTVGGTWNVTGLYDIVITPTNPAGYAQGSYFDVLATYAVSSTVYTQTFRFGVA